MNKPLLRVVMDAPESAVVGGFVNCPMCQSVMLVKNSECPCCKTGFYWLDEAVASLDVRSVAADRDNWRAVAEANADAANAAKEELNELHRVCNQSLADAQSWKRKALALENEVVPLRDELDHWKRYGTPVGDVPAFLRKDYVEPLTM